MSTFTSREFNHDVSAAKRAAVTEPVIITDRGQPSHVLLSYRDYHDLVDDGRGVVERLSADDDLDLDVEPLDLTLRIPDL